MNQSITQYNLVFCSVSKQSLYVAHQSLLQSEFLVSPNFKCVFHKDQHLYTHEVLVSVAESVDFSFSDYLDDFLSNHPNITVSSEFTDYFGKGVLNPNLTKNYITSY